VGVRSFLVHVAPGTAEDVARVLQSDPSCEVYPAENRDVIVVVSDLDDRAAEAAFDERLSAMPGVLGVALVAGYQA
jgi:nitrate reductase NapAB chaperone NapD